MGKPNFEHFCFKSMGNKRTFVPNWALYSHANLSSELIGIFAFLKFALRK